MTTPEQPGDPNNPTPGEQENPATGDPQNSAQSDPQSSAQSDPANPAPGGQEGQDGGDGSTPKKRTPVALITGGGIAAVVVIVAVVFGTLYATNTAPFGGDDDADITNAAEAYVDAFNSEKVDNVRAVLCSNDAAMLANVKDGEGTDTPITVDSVSDITVQDGTATAKLSASMDVEGQPNQQNVTLAFKNEGGNWKVCPSLNPAAGAPQGAQGGQPAPQAPQGGQPAPQAPQGN